MRFLNGLLFKSLAAGTLLGGLVKVPQISQRMIVGVGCALFAAGILLVAISRMLPSPAVGFHITLEVSRAEMRQADQTTYFSDLQGAEISVALPAKAPPKTNNLLSNDAFVSNERHTFEIQNELTPRIGEFSLPAKSLLTLTYAENPSELILSVDQDKNSPKKAELSVIWPQLVNESDDSGASLKLNSKVLSGEAVTVQILDPISAHSIADPYSISGLSLVQPSDRRSHRKPMNPRSTIRSGTVQFFAFDIPLPINHLQAGELLLLKGLEAEVSSVGISSDAVTLRLFGTAEDILSGFGSSVKSIYPSAYDGFGAHPIVQVTLSVIAGLLFSLFGAISLGHKAENQS